MRQSLLFVALLFLATNACSSTSEGTVTRTPFSTPGTIPGTEEQEPGESDADATGTRASSSLTPSPGSVVELPPPGRDTRKPGRPPLPPGVDDETVTIGIWYLATGSACGAFGIQPSGDEQCGGADESEYSALADYVNAHGGLGGRRLRLVFFQTEATTRSYDAQSEAACASFTQDHEVFAVISEGQAGRSSMAHCLARNKVPFVEPGFYPFDNKEYRELSPFIYQPHRARPERWVRSYIDGLHDAGFFAKDARIGLVRFETGPHSRVTARVLKPRLAKYGLTLTEEAVIRQPPSFASYSDMQSEIATAVLQFKSSNIDRVIFFTSVAEIELFWFQQAESQRFRPIYGFNSVQSPKFVSQIAPSEQLRNALGVGWSPFFDVAPAQDPGGSPGADLCATIMKDAGLDPGTGRNNKCDSVLFLKAAFDRAATLGDIGPQGLRRAVEGIGSDFLPSASFSTRFGPGRYDGPSSLRYTFFDQGCDCFRYRGRLRPLP